MHKDSLGNSPGTERKYAAAVYSRKKTGADGNQPNPWHFYLVHVPEQWLVRTGGQNMSVIELFSTVFFLVIMSYEKPLPQERCL